MAAEPGSSSSITPRRRSSALSAGPWMPIAPLRCGAGCNGRRCGRITPGTSRRGSMSKCTERIPEDTDMASEMVQTLTDANFEQTVNHTPQPVLVDFWAEWCGPCRRLAPTVDELANDYNGRVVVAKMNVDENPATPMRFSIRGIPTLLLFKGGQLVEQVVGLADKDALKELIDKHV